ncbi:MAG TPA: argininosuccinate synthase domain-containing protein [Vicinamibacterales bacterium]|nr:argininosuccinate synthase domain-containing protein [Vicinamibacterales bacterium]
MKRLVLAYSGSRAAALAIPRLAEKYDAEIVALVLDVGQGKDLEAIRDRALSTGAVRAHVLDVREEFARQYMLRALRANALFRDGSSLTPALLRPLIAQKLVEIADIEQTLAIAHGYPPDDMGINTAARALNPKMKVLASLPRAAGSSPAIPAAKRPADCPDEPAYLEVTFERGTPTATNGIAMSLLDLTSTVAVIAAAHGIGSLVQTDAAAAVLQAAHRELQRSVLTEVAQSFSKVVSQQYADIIATGSWFSMLREALDAYIDKIQHDANGVIRLKLLKGACEVVERKPSTRRYTTKHLQIATATDIAPEH